MQEKNKQKLLLLGKITLFLLTYVGLVSLFTIIAENIFTGGKFYDRLPFDLFHYAAGIFITFLFVKIVDKEDTI